MQVAVPEAAFGGITSWKPRRGSFLYYGDEIIVSSFSPPMPAFFNEREDEPDKII